jgi:hypothetical protein
MAIERVPNHDVECEYCSQLLALTDVEDHFIICDEVPVPCTNAQFGCQQILKRKDVNVHIAHCPASITTCFYTYSCQEPNIEVHQDDLDLNQDDELELQEDSESINAPSASIFFQTLSDETTNELISGRLAKSSNGGLICGLFIRRDEFESHWLSHIELTDDLFLKIRRCPLSVYGCQKSVQYFILNGYEYRYKDFFNSIVAYPHTVQPVEESDTAIRGHYAALIEKKKELAIYGHTDDYRSIDVMGQLPVEVLMQILSHLDSLSLWSLSQVNRYFRYICEDMLVTKGIVYCHWKSEKVETGIEENETVDEVVNWKESVKKWSFSRAFSSSHHWLPTNKESSICSHLTSCDKLALAANIRRKEFEGFVWDTNECKLLPSNEVNYTRYK